jgi:hypothetical protein
VNAAAPVSRGRFLRPAAYLQEPDKEQDDDDEQDYSASDVHFPSLLGFGFRNEEGTDLVAAY